MKSFWSLVLGSSLNLFLLPSLTMGAAASSSLEALSKEDVAAAVSSLGTKYEEYAESIIENGIDGDLLAGFDEQDLVDTFEELGVSSKLHRKVLKKEWEKAKQQTAEASTTPVNKDSSTNLSPTASKDVNAPDITGTEKSSAEKTTMTDVCDETELNKYADITEKILEDMGPNTHIASVNLLSQETQHSLSFRIRSKKGPFQNIPGLELPMSYSLCKRFVDDPTKENMIYRIPDDFPLNAPNGDTFTGPHRYMGHVLRTPEGERVGAVCALEEISGDIQDKKQERLELLEELAVIAENNLKEGKALRYRNDMLKKQIQEKKAAQQQQNAERTDMEDTSPKEQVVSSNEEQFGFATCTAEDPIYHQGLAETEQDLEHLPPNFFTDLDTMGVVHPPIRKDDIERVAAVKALGLAYIQSGDPLLKALNNLVAMTTRMFGYQIAQITIHDNDSEYGLCQYGFDDLQEQQRATLTAPYTPLESPCVAFKKDRNISTCNYGIHSKKTIVLNDSWNDKTFWWTKELNLFRAYVGSPIFNLDGHVVAMLCMWDFRETKAFDKTNVEQMEQIAFSISQLLENWALRREMEQLERERESMEHVQVHNEKASPPQNEAAIVLTDVQGSTSLWEADPEAMQDALKVHDEIMRACYQRNCGYEITTEGDAFLLAFHDAVDAIRFALEAQVALHEANWADDILKLPDAAADDGGSFRGLRVRMGIHFGPVSCLENEVTGRMEYKGETWNIAKNIEAMCHGGQILATADAWRVASWVAESLNSPQVVDVGEYVVSTGKVLHEGLVSKRVIQLVPKQLAFDYFSSRRQSVACSDDSRQESTTPEMDKGTCLTGRSFPPPLSKRKLRASFYDAPYMNGEVTVAFIYTSEVKENVEEPDSVLAALAKFFSSLLVEFDGYECKSGMYAFENPAQAVKFGLKLMQMLQTRPVEGESNLARLLKVGVHSGVFTSMGPNPTTGRADYYGQVVNRAARVAGAASPGGVYVGVIADETETPNPLLLDEASIQTEFVERKLLKGVSKEMALFSCS